MLRMHRMLLVLATTAAATAVGAVAQQQDTVRAGARAAADTTRRPRATTRRPAPTRGDTLNPRATARDRVGADDPRCDDLCLRERMMDSVYGKDRERLPAAQRRDTTRRP